MPIPHALTRILAAQAVVQQVIELQTQQIIIQNSPAQRRRDHGDFRRAIAGHSGGAALQNNPVPFWAEPKRRKMVGVRKYILLLTRRSAASHIARCDAMARIRGRRPPRTHWERLRMQTLHSTDRILRMQILAAKKGPLVQQAVGTECVMGII